MNQIQLFGLGNQSRSSNLTAGHRLNMFYDVQVDNDKTTVAAVCTPGLELFARPSDQKAWGMHWMESTNRLYVFQGSTLYAVAPDGSVEALFSIGIGDVTNFVSMANNGTQLLLVTGKFAAIYDTSTSTFYNVTSSIPYGGQVANVCTFLNGRFIINRPETGQFFYSDLYDGLSWPGLNFATAESTPDNLISLTADKEHLILFGSSSIEIWSDTGDVLNVFGRINSAPTEAGLAARWSLSRCRGYVVGLFKNRSGMLFCAMLNGYTLDPISNKDIEFIFNGYQHTADAVGFGYTQNGCSFYQITFPTEGVSWLYNSNGNQWSQVKGYEIPRHRAELSAAFGNSIIVSDYENGNLYTLSSAALTDNGEIIEREITSAHVYATSRNKMTVRRLRVDMEGGVGLINTQPNVMLQISRDNGHTWGSELWTTFGKEGEFLSRAEWRRLGLARDWVFKIRITDPVKVVIIAAIVDGQELNK